MTRIYCFLRPIGRLRKSIPILISSVLLAALPLAGEPELYEVAAAPGNPGGRLVVALSAEPNTFNPVTLNNTPSRTVVRRLHADLIHTDRVTRASQPALAESWTVSPDGRRFTLELRHGVRFSDGHPFDADDVVFTFQVYLDPEIASGYLPLLTVGGEPVRLEKLGSHRLAFELAEPYAVGVKLFDSIPILPRHRLERAYREGRFAAAWGVDAASEEIVGLGPFRLRRYVPGERLELERNPHYWKVDRSGRRLPYLDELVFVFVPSREAQLARFTNGELDVIERLSAESFHLLERQRSREHALYDLGPGFVFHFLFFNLNDVDAERLPEVARKQAWFRDPAFRRAVSAAIDRRGIVRLVYRGRAAALASHVTPGDELWFNSSLEPPRRSLDTARRLLREAGYRWDDAGRLHDPGDRRVTWTLVTNSSSSERVQMAAVIQEDMRQIGVEVRVVPIEFSSLVARVTQSLDYEAAILGLTSGTDPNEVINVWTSDGTGRLWRLRRVEEEPPWQREVDRLMRRQVTAMDPAERKRLYDRVQEILAEREPCLLLVSPNVLVAADRGLGNFRPTIREHVTLWNVDELYWMDEDSGDDGSGNRR